MASRNIGSIYASLTLSDINFRRGLANASKAMNRFAAKSLKWGAVAAVGALTTEIYSAVKAASEMQDISIQFEVLTGSAEKAKDMLSRLRSEAAKSPLGFSDFAKAAQTLIGFGADQSKVIEYTKELSEVSGGNADRFKSLALAFAQSGAAGRLMGQDVLQFINAGFNPLLQISKKTGESMVELKKRMEAGLIPFSEVEQAFKDATSAGGMFFGMNEKASKTFSGRIAKLKDQFQQFQIQIGTPIIDGISPIFDKLEGYDMAALGERLGKAIETGLSQLIDGSIWEKFALQGEKAFATLASSEVVNGWAATLNTIWDGITGQSGDGPGDFGATFDKYAKAGIDANVEVIDDLQARIDAIDAKTMAKIAAAKVMPPPSPQSSAAGSISSSAVVVPVKYEYQGMPQTRPDVNEYQRRGLSLDGNPQVKTETILEKQTNVLVEMRDALKRMVAMNPTAVW